MARSQAVALVVVVVVVDLEAEAAEAAARGQKAQEVEQQEVDEEVAVAEQGEPQQHRGEEAGKAMQVHRPAQSFRPWLGQCTP